MTNMGLDSIASPHSILFMTQNILPSFILCIIDILDIKNDQVGIFLDLP
jgi:hypothetical protein